MNNTEENRTLAICFFNTGSKNIDELTNRCLSRFDKFTITFFNDATDDEFKSLWLVAFKKRCAELADRKDFDICLCINGGSNDDLLDHVTIPENLDDKLYYSTGFHYWEPGGIERMGMYPTGIFSNSLLFDRLAEYVLSPSVDPIFLGGRKDQSERLYNYIKVLRMEVECINYENSDLFKRTA